MSEVWKPIPGYHAYEASSEGRVRSVDRMDFVRSGHGCFMARKRRGQIIHQDLNLVTGYMQVALGRGTKKRVHQVIAETFIGPRPKDFDTCHINGIRTDNRAENFMYGTRAENFSHMIAHGTAVRGENHGGAKFTNDDIACIFGRVKSGETHASVARAFNVSRSAVSNIVRGKNWAHLTNAMEA